MGGAPWKGRRQDGGAGMDGVDSPEDGRAQLGGSETGYGDNKRVEEGLALTIQLNDTESRRFVMCDPSVRRLKRAVAEGLLRPD